MKELKYSASKLHKLGSRLREKDNLEESLVYETLALVRYAKVNDYSGVIDTLQGRFLTWKHLFLISDNSIYLECAESDARISLFLTEKHSVEEFFSKSYFRMGEACMLKRDYKNAENYYSQALNFFEGSLSEKGDYRYHLGEALYRSNRKDEGYKTMLKGLSEIEKGKKKIDSFHYNVWKSGCFGRLAELLSNDNPPRARDYLMKVDEIIKSDPRLIIRKRQLEELKKKLKAR